MLGDSRVDAQLVASQVLLSSIELVYAEALVVLIGGTVEKNESRVRKLSGQRFQREPS
jgi:hypothetical protein